MAVGGDITPSASLLSCSFGSCHCQQSLSPLVQIELSEFDVLYSRGIDPLVLNPSICHSHPEVPSEWPSKQQLLNYVAEV
jgi:hypothetical protein